MPITDCLLQLEASLLTQEVRASYDELNRLIADDFVEVGASGRRFGKADVLMRLPTERGTPASALNMSVRMLAPTVGMVTFDTVRLVGGESRFVHRASIWTLNGDRWQMTYHQGTIAANTTA
jgi:hypothetical protein